MTERKRSRKGDDPKADVEAYRDKDDEGGGEGEQRGSVKMGVAVITGNTFANKSVVYYEVEGMALVEGDIALGTVERVQRATEIAREAVTGNPNIAFGVGITGSQFRWPNCRIPYEIDPNLPNQQRVTDAIAHWEANTSFRFPLRTQANASQHPNWVRFTDAGGCWSMVGMQGGQQTISLGAGCSTGNAIHEIGHAVGLWHEQSREDRDLFVTINWQNIQAGMAAQFNQHIVDGDDQGTYDYGSIMHYPRTAFSSNGQDTITPTNPNAQIGQRNSLSAGDVAAVRAMYPVCAVVKNPASEPLLPFKKLRDDRPFKKVIDDQRVFKKLRDDRLPKALRDPKIPRDPGPIKTALDPMPIPRPGGLPLGTGSLQPFSIATPHHADLAAAEYAAAGMDEVQQQLLDLDAEIAQARAVAASATAEAAKLEQFAQALIVMLEGSNPGGA